jgi:hypothetical protein
LSDNGHTEAVLSNFRIADKPGTMLLGDTCRFRVTYLFISIRV